MEHYASQMHYSCTVSIETFCYSSLNDTWTDIYAKMIDKLCIPSFTESIQLTTYSPEKQSKPLLWIM